MSIRHGDKADATMIVTALGVDVEGNKEVLALRACAEEDKDGWACLLQDLPTRGATHIDLIVTDGPEHCLGHHPGYPLAQTLAGMKLTNVAGLMKKQPTMKRGSGEGVLLCLFWPVFSTA